MTRVAKRPLNEEACHQADEDFYKAHENDPRPNACFDEHGNRKPLSATDPDQTELRKEWMDLYICHGGEIEGDKKGNKPDDPKKKCPHKKELEGEILEVHFQSGIKVAYEKKTVVAPHWKQGEDVTDGAASKRPAVYLVPIPPDALLPVPRGASDRLMAKVRITKSENVSSPGKLSTKLGSLEITGECPTSLGEHDVQCKIENLPQSIQWCKGDTAWQLDVKADNMVVTLKNTPRLEVFVVLDPPADYYLSKKGVWTKALRFLCDKVGLVGKATHKQVSKTITEFCHGSHGLSYDTTRGAPAYGCSGLGGTFRLDSYIDAAFTTVNCFDQAAAVQSLAGAVGTTHTWIFMQPYGFIKKTDLIGVGQCNNPFFDSNGSAKVIGVNDTDRTPFGNHAFCELQARIYDACAGPHVGTESRTEYVDAAIDKATKLYNRFLGFRAGTAADMKTPAGVTSVT